MRERVNAWNNNSAKGTAHSTPTARQRRAWPQGQWEAPIPNLPSPTRGTSNWNPGAAREAAAPSPVLLGAGFGAVDLGPFRGFGTGRSCGVGAVLVFWDGRGPGAALFALLSAGLPLDMVNDRNKRGIHTVRGRLGSPRTPMIAFNSVIVTCLARSTAWATCCWCCGDRGARSAIGPPQTWSPLFWVLFCLFFPIFLPYFGCSSPGAPPGSVGRGSSSSGKRGSPLQPFGLSAAPQTSRVPAGPSSAHPKGFPAHRQDLNPIPHTPRDPKGTQRCLRGENPGRSCIPSKRVWKSPYLL